MAKKKASEKKSEPAAASQGDGGAAQEQAGELSILVQYIKDLSFESPNAPMSLQGPGENPRLTVNVNVQAEAKEDDIYEVSLNFEGKTTNDAGVIYNLELVYAGIFKITGIPNEYLQQVLFVDCPTLLFPFMRRIIADMTQEGAFPPLMLDPIDFAKLYRENQAQIQASAKTS
ncbi:MAG: protein-export chaperone SecB [Methyloligellaceae bacterium]|nr:MAG: protein-export chaperone SecB [Alphaproteobacteria bacterium]